MQWCHARGLLKWGLGLSVAIMFMKSLRTNFHSLEQCLNKMFPLFSDVMFHILGDCYSATFPQCQPSSLSRGIQAGRRFDRRGLRGGGGGVNNTHSCSWRNPCREWIASETQFRAEKRSDAKSANRRKEEESIGGPFCALVPKSAYNPPWLTAREGADYVCRPRSPTLAPR